MGADTTATQLIFFIAATVVATAAAGVMAGTVTDLVGKAQQRSDSFSEELVSEVKIINDPSRVVASPTTVIYVRNTGDVLLDYTQATVIIDGTVVTVTNSLLGGETSFRTGAVAQYTYSSSLASGDHRVSVSMHNGVHDELRFRV
jgi:archaellum component FlaG (FlaF/FlaG flagellin family)